MNNRFLRLKSGRILLSIARHPNEDFGKKIEESGDSGTAYTDDEGRTWKFSNWISGNVQEPMAVETESGRLLLFFRTNRGYIYTCESYDEGETWCNETCTGIKMPTAPFTISKDPYSGYVFLIWIDSFPGLDRPQYPRSPIKMAVSRDNCRSFQTVMTFDDNPKRNYGYPAIFFTPDRILVNYYENPESPRYQYDKHIIKLCILERSEMTFDMTVKVPLFPG